MIDLIRVVREGGRVRVWVGDVEIPGGALPVGRDDALLVPVETDGVATVRLELTAKRVEVVNSHKTEGNQ